MGDPTLHKGTNPPFDSGQSTSCALETEINKCLMAAVCPVSWAQCWSSETHSEPQPEDALELWPEDALEMWPEDALELWPEDALDHMELRAFGKHQAAHPTLSHPRGAAFLVEASCKIPERGGSTHPHPRSTSDLF